MLFRSKMGLLRRCRNWTSLRLRRSFGSNSDGKKRGLALWDWCQAAVREEDFLLKSKMGLLRRCRNRTSLKLHQSFGSNNDGKERGLALCGLVLGCYDNGLKEMQLRRGEREKI